MRAKTTIALAIYGLMFAGLIFYAWLVITPSLGVAQGKIQPVKGRGEYLAIMADCTSCHTAEGHPKFAGGYKLHSPFGTIYGTNITPDPETGIGRYSLEDFTRAVRQGIAKDGSHIYPAMPYPSFSLMTDQDVSDLYDYFMHEVKPVHYQPPQTKLAFPYSQRWALEFWDWTFASNKRYAPQDDHDESWNRGAYLVLSLGHCGACHTPRGPAYEERGTSPASSYFLHGGTLDNWYAANLSGNMASGLGRWSQEDITEFLKTGHGAGTTAFGSMKEVVENSGQHMTDADRLAIAHYLKSLPAEGEQTDYHPVQPVHAAMFEKPGAGIYAGLCAQCHQPEGTGRAPAFPALSGNAMVLSEDPTSLIRLMLEGSRSPQTVNGPKPEAMPGFSRWTDREIAEVLTYIRGSWQNAATPVTERQVKALREALKSQSE